MPKHGDYLTDGIHLFRFEGFHPDRKQAYIEDAKTERIWAVPNAEISRMKRVRPLRKGADADA